MIKVDKRELDAFAIKIHKKAVKGNEEAIRKAIRKSCLAIKKGAIENLTNNGTVETGHLRRSIAFRTKMEEGVVHTSKAKYGIVIEKGAKPHVIRAKNKKALYWEGASYPVRKVNHPGSKAKPFLVPALQSEKPNFIENLKEAIKFD